MAKTIEERLEAARNLVAKYEAQIASDRISANVAVGDAVVVKFGRGAKVRDVNGTVVGIKDRTAVVLDADLRTVRVNFRDIVANTTAAEREAAGNPAEAEASSADADPLSEA